jgi:hypothetical protein
MSTRRHALSDRLVVVQEHTLRVQSTLFPELSEYLVYVRVIQEDCNHGY